MAEGLLRPAEAARELGVAPNTLRVYSTRFAAALSVSAARPSAGEGGGAGHRLYDERDIAVLRRARDLVAAGATYDEALAGLRVEYGLPGPTAPRSIDLSTDLAGHLATLQQAVDAWRSLAEERAREIGDLRARLAARESELIDERRARLRAEQMAGGETRAARAGESAPRRQADRPTGQNSWLARVFSSEGDDRGTDR